MSVNIFSIGFEPYVILKDKKPIFEVEGLCMEGVRLFAEKLDCTPMYEKPTTASTMTAEHHSVVTKFYKTNITNVFVHSIPALHGAYYASTKSYMYETCQVSCAVTKIIKKK